MTPRVIAFTATITAWIGAICLPTSGALAWDAYVDAETRLAAYEVRSPGTTAFIARRRLVQSLELEYADALGDEDGTRRPPRLRVALRLRLDQDFGSTCFVRDDICVRATDARDRGNYLAIARDTAIDAPLIYAEVDNLPMRSRLRGGRQLLFDTLGFARIDGASARVEPFSWLAADVAGGLLVTRTSLAGSDAFALQGVPRFDLDSGDRASAAYVAEPADPWLVSASIEVGPREVARARAVHRELVGGEGLLLRRTGFSLVSEPNDALRTEMAGVLDHLTSELIDAQASLRYETEEATFDAMLAHHVPRFDPSTIWAYFISAPVTDASMGVDWRVDEALALSTSLRGRRTDLDSDARAPTEDDEIDIGMEAGARMRFGALRLEASGFGWVGQLSPFWGLRVDAMRPLGSKVSLEGRVSLWHFDEGMRDDYGAVILSESLGARVHLSKRTKVSVDLEHAYSRLTGQRFRLLAALSIEVWR